MQIQGIVFDKDGTLFDFNATWGAWTRGMLQDEAPDAHTMTQLADVLGYDLKRGVFRPGSIVIAETIDVVAEHMLRVLPAQDKAALIARMARLATDVPQVPVGDLTDILGRLQGFGLTLGVATNDNEAPARAHLDRAGVTQMFAHVFGADSGFGGKPATGQLDQFCATTGLAAQNCVMVGDSLHDLHAARAAGMIPIGVLTGPAPEAELAPFARAVLPSIAALPDWIAANG